MTTFEVTVQSTLRADAESAPLRLLVEADNWVAAWREGLRFVGRAELPEDAVCTTGHDTGMLVEVPSDGTRFQVRPLAEHRGPRPLPGQPLVLAAGAPAAHAAAGLEPARPPVPRSTATSATPDPIAKVLSDLERQRLLSRPVRISSWTGLPTGETRPPRRVPTPQTVPRPVSTSAAGADTHPRPTTRTQAFPAAPEELLPQQFRPVQAERGPPRTFDLALRWAVETAWNHVPCALALLVTCREDRLAEIIAARGAREREARGCSVACDSGPAQMSRAPSLTRFSAPRPLRFLPADARAWEIPVTSVLTAPVQSEDGEPTDLGLVLLNASRASGFTDSELRAVSYLARTLASRL